MKRIIYLLLAVLLLTCGCTKAPRQSSSLKQYNITVGGEHTLSGEIADTTVTVDAGKADVTILFDNVTLENSKGPALYIKSAGNVSLVLKDGTVNTLSDGDGYDIKDDKSALDAVLFSRADLTVSGNGALKINGNYKHGIVSKDDLVISSGTFEIKSNNVGLYGKDCVEISDADIKINAGSDGIRSDNEDADKGYINIFNSTLDITAGHDGIQAQSILKSENADVTVKTGEGSEETLSSSEESYKGLKAGSEILISGGTYDVDSQDDCVHSNGNVSVSGGTLTLSSGDDGIHADDDFTMTDGSVTILKSYEGTEGSKLVFSGGSTDIMASDDGLNAAGGNDASSMGDRPGHGGFGSSTGSITISGGDHLITALGDGVDSNGTVSVTGGVTFVSGPQNSGNGALDYDGSATVTGGTFIALGSSGMAQNFSEAQNQSSVLVNFDNTSGGTPFAVCDSSGKVLITFTPQNSYSSAVFTSPDIKSGNSYILKSDVNELTTVEVTSSVVGSGGMNPGGGMGPGGMRSQRSDGENRHQKPMR